MILPLLLGRRLESLLVQDYEERMDLQFVVVDWTVMELLLVVMRKVVYLISVEMIFVVATVDDCKEV